MEISIKHPLRFFGLLLLIFSVTGGAGFFGGWKVRDASISGVVSDPKLREDFDKFIGEFRQEFANINSAVGVIGETTGNIAESVESGFRGVEIGIGELSDIKASGGKATDIAREIGTDSTSIREASAGLAGLVGIEIPGDRPAEEK